MRQIPRLRLIAGLSLFSLSCLGASLPQPGWARTSVDEASEAFSTEPPELAAQHERARQEKLQAIMDGRYDFQAARRGKNPIKKPAPAPSSPGPGQGKGDRVQAGPVRSIEALSWVLADGEHPGILRCVPVELGTHLLLDLPSRKELLLMLPGQTQDFVGRTTAAAQKFVKDSLDSGSAGRTRQYEGISKWSAQVLDIRRKLSSAPWTQYQFAAEVRRSAEPCLAVVKAQSARALSEYARVAQNAVGKLSPLLSAFTDQAQALAAYSILLKLRDGAGLLSVQLAQGDARSVSDLEQVLALVPALAEPKEPLPAPPSAIDRLARANGVELVPPGMAVAASNVRNARPDPVAAAPVPTRASAPSAPVSPGRSARDSGSPLGTAIILLLSLALCGYGVLKLHRRKSQSAK